MLILADLEKFDLKELRRCTSAGEPLNPEVVRVWMEGTGRTISEGYGQTETVCCIGTFRGMETRPGSMGRPAPGWHVELHDDEGKPVEQGEEGRIAIGLEPRPVGLFAEYLNSPEANATSFVNGFYYTGDKATMDADGYFWFVGRNDDIIKTRVPHRSFRGGECAPRAPGRPGVGSGGIAGSYPGCDRESLHCA